MTDHSHISLSDRDEPVLLAWPTRGNAGRFIQFEKAAEWRAFVSGLGVGPRIAEIVRAKFARAQTLFLLGWADFCVLRAGELVALIASELALMDRYRGRLSKNKRRFAALLKYVVEADGLTNAQSPLVVRCGGAALGQLAADTPPPLEERRNAMANSDPFDGLPTGGLLKLARDLINFTCRRYVAEAAGLGLHPTTTGRA